MLFSANLGSSSITTAFLQTQHTLKLFRMFSLWHIAIFLTISLVNGVTITVDTAQSWNAGANAIDQNNSTFWHSQYSPTTPLPHAATLDLLVPTWISGFSYLPRQDNVDAGSRNGNIGQHDIEISDDELQWTTVVSNVCYNP